MTRNEDGGLTKLEKERIKYNKRKKRHFREDFYAKKPDQCRLSELCPGDLRVGKFSIDAYYSNNICDENHGDSDVETEVDKFEGGLLYVIHVGNF